MVIGAMAKNEIAARTTALRITRPPRPEITTNATAKAMPINIGFGLIQADNPIINPATA